MQMLHQLDVRRQRSNMRHRRPFDGQNPFFEVYDIMHIRQPGVHVLQPSVLVDDAHGLVSRDCRFGQVKRHIRRIVFDALDEQIQFHGAHLDWDGDSQVKFSMHRYDDRVCSRLHDTGPDEN